MAQLVFDIESNGLLHEATKLWLIGTKDIDTGEENVYGPDEAELLEGVCKLKSADLLVGHNIINFDIMLLRRLYSWFEHKNLVDTMLMSQSLQHDRKGGHSLDAWGQKLGIKKPEYENWEVYTPEMDTRVLRDVQINAKVYDALREDFNKLSPVRQAAFRKMHRVEQTGAYFCAEAGLYGWPFDDKLAEELLEKYEKEYEDKYDLLKPKMGVRVKPIDGWEVCLPPNWLFMDTASKKKLLASDKAPTAEHRDVSVRKNGQYYAHICKWFDVEPESALEKFPPIAGPYTRVQAVELVPSSKDDQKVWLKRVGWKPDQWNQKKRGPKREKTSPKLTDESLGRLGEIGNTLIRFNSLAARLPTIRTWLYTNKTEDGRVHPDLFYQGASTFRCTHKIIANIPKPKNQMGREIRSLFTSGLNRDITMIGADSCGNQMRGFCHFLRNDDFTDQVLNGDVHTVNMEILDGIIETAAWTSANDIIRRDRAKRLLYALLFGAGPAKCAEILIDDIRQTKLGKRVRDQFISAIPGFEKLNKGLEEQAKKHKYIVGVDGRAIPVKFPHMALAYLLQHTEKISMAAAIYVITTEMKKAGLWYQPLIFYHDEIATLVRKDELEDAIPHFEKGFVEGPKMFGIQIMEGDVKFGDTWLEIH